MNALPTRSADELAFFIWVVISIVKINLHRL